MQPSHKYQETMNRKNNKIKFKIQTAHLKTNNDITQPNVQHSIISNQLKTKQK